MDRNGNLRNRTAAAIDSGRGDTERLATEWAMPFIPEDNSTSPTDIPFTTARRSQRPVSGCVTFFGRILMLFGLVVLLSGVYGGFNMLTREAHRTMQPIVKTVSGVPDVVIENSIGNVQVLVGSQPEVKVVADIEVRHISQGLANEAVDNYELKVDDSEPGTVKITANDLNPFTDDDVFAGWLAHRSVNLTVTVPANSNLAFDVAAGRMNVEGITGRMNAVVHAGSLNLIDVKLADGSTFDVNAGSLFLSGELLPDADLNVIVNAGSAEIELPKSTNAYLNAHANAGSVRANDWPGPVARTRTDEGTNITGSLTSFTGKPNSEITVTVNAGSASISPQSDRTFDIERPSIPSLIPAPSAPPAPSRSR